jgi:tyrosyl-tRNA synthetase
MGGAQLFALTTPLLTKSSGEKMGKSASGAVWLNGELFSPYDFWQYFRNTEDADVGRWLKIFTRLPLDEIARLEALGGSELNEAKKILATEVTTIVHGRDAAEKAAATAAATFEAGAIDLSLPTTEVAKGELAAGVGLLKALVSAGVAASNGEARRHVQSGAVRVNDEIASDERASLGTTAILPEGVIKLSVGKKKHALLKPV